MHKGESIGYPLVSGYELSEVVQELRLMDVFDAMIASLSSLSRRRLTAKRTMSGF